MARVLLLALVAISLVAGSQACIGCIFKQLAGFDCGPKFDLPSSGKSYSKICGGQLKVEQACIGNGKCGLYTFGGDKDCGYLKSATAFPQGKVVKENLVPSKTWNVYYKEVKVPVPVPVPIPVEVIRTVTQKVPVPVPVPTPPQVITRVVEKRVEVPVDRIVEKRVEVPVDRIVEKRVEVPVDRIVEKRVEVPVDRIVEKRVEVPVDRIVEKRVEVPVVQERVVEKRVEVPVPVPVPVPGPTRYIRYEEKTLSKSFDIKTPSTPAYRVCGGLQAVSDTCGDTAGCEGYSMDANGKCGYLKSSGGRPTAYAQPGAFQPAPAGAVTYVEESALPATVIAQGEPVEMGEVIGDVAGGVAGGIAQGVTSGVVSGVVGGLLGRRMM